MLLATVPAAVATAALRTAPAISAPQQAPSDPRHVLAQRVSEQLEGAILPADKRRALLRLGVALGLTLFDANLVLAIVQDQARRGGRSAVGDRLTLLSDRSADRPARGRTRLAALIIATILGAEALVLAWLFH
jgi:hypothetical protein